MNKKFLAAIIGVLSILASKAEAQGIVFVAQDSGMPMMQGYQGYNIYPEVLVHVPSMNQDNVVFQNSSFVETGIMNPQNQAPAVQNATNAENKDISYYMQHMILSPEQLNRAQDISNTSNSKKQQLLQSIETLKEQVNEIENDGLRDFEAILTDSQKAEFNRLRNEQEAVSQPEPQPETQPEQPQEVYTEPQPEAQPEQSKEVYTEPQPEVQPEQPQEVYTEPQPEPQPEQPQEVYTEPQQEPQPEQSQEVYTEPQPEPQSEQPQEVYTEPQPEPQPEQPQEVYTEPQPEPQPEQPQEVYEEPQPDPQPEQPQEVYTEPQPENVQ